MACIKRKNTCYQHREISYLAHMHFGGQRAGPGYPAHVRFVSQLFTTVNLLPKQPANTTDFFFCGSEAQTQTEAKCPLTLKIFRAKALGFSFVYPASSFRDGSHP